jgi:hypothetical protein
MRYAEHPDRAAELLAALDRYAEARRSFLAVLSLLPTGN